jgi:hypothetical protein
MTRTGYYYMQLTYSRCSVPRRTAWLTLTLFALPTVISAQTADLCGGLIYLPRISTFLNMSVHVELLFSDTEAIHL